MKNKGKEQLKEGLEFKNDNEKFNFEPNKLTYYYQKVFNIEIISFLRKKNKGNQELGVQYDQNIMQNNILRHNNTAVYILIKDNNKKIFKYKLLKSYINVEEFLNENTEETKQNVDFNKIFYYSVDKTLCNYCNKKHYIDNVDIGDKDMWINFEYQHFLENQDNQ